MYTKFDTTNIEDVKNTIQMKLDELKYLGLNIELKKITYDNDSFKSSIEVNLPGALNKYEKAFNELIVGHPKLVSDDLNVNIWLYNGKQYKIIGYNTRARKFPLLIRLEGTTLDYKVSFNEFIYRGERLC